MKVKNLLLAGLAVAAMTACSNDIEGVDNSNPVASEDASMNLKFAFSNLTRAVEDGGTSAGENVEWGATEVTVVLDYGEAKPVIIEKLGTLTAGQGNTMVAETEKFAVKSGPVKVYAFLNPGSTSFSNGLTNLTTTASAFPQSGLDYLTDGVAKDNQFMMSNVGGTPVEVNIIAGSQENSATISVERVCAKIEEATEIKKFTLTKQTVTGPKASIELVQHTYANLAKASYVLSQTPCWASANTDAYFNQYTTTNPAYNWISGKTSTYCFENIIDGAWDINKHTSVLYEGQVYFEGESNPSPTFYVKENPATSVREIFRTWADLKDAYTGLKDQENADDLSKFSIDKYADGKCYYLAAIEDFNLGVSIARNNWYKLNVTTIADLGYPTPVIPTPEDTKLKVEVEIQPWKINLNNIGL